MFSCMPHLLCFRACVLFAASQLRKFHRPAANTDDVVTVPVQPKSMMTPSMSVMSPMMAPVMPMTEYAVVTVPVAMVAEMTEAKSE